MKYFQHVVSAMFWTLVAASMMALPIIFEEPGIILFGMALVAFGPLFLYLKLDGNFRCGHKDWGDRERLWNRRWLLAAFFWHPLVLVVGGVRLMVAFARYNRANPVYRYPTRKPMKPIAKTTATDSKEAPAFFGDEEGQFWGSDICSIEGRIYGMDVFDD